MKRIHTYVRTHACIHRHSILIDESNVLGESIQLLTLNLRWVNIFSSSISHRLKQYLICICEMNMCGHTLTFTVCALDEVEMALFCIFPSVNWIKRTRERSEKTKRIAQTTKPIHCFYIINLRKKWKSNKQTQNLGLLLHFIEWQPIQSLKYINPIHEHNL